MVTLTNDLVARNDASDGGGVHVSLSGCPSQAHLVNNTIADNSASGVQAGPTLS